MIWRPAREGRSQGEATPLSASLEQVAARIGAPSPKALSAVFEKWDGVVGEQIAAHCRPVSMAQGVVTVAVDDQRWATQLRWISSEVVERLNAAAGADVVDGIEVRFESRRSPD